MKNILKKYKYIILLLILSIGVFATISFKETFESDIKIVQKNQNKIDAKYYEDGSLYLNEFLKAASAYDKTGEELKEINQLENLSTVLEDVEIKFDYEIPLAVLYSDGEWDGRVRYELPIDVIANYPSINGEVKQGDIVVGTYSIENEIIDIQFFADQISEGTAIVGEFYFWAKLDYSDQVVSGEKKYIFSNRAVIGLQVNLFTRLNVEKTAFDPVIDYEKNTVDFKYNVKISSVSGTEGSLIVKDVLTNAYSYNEYDELVDFKLELYDYKNEKKPLDENLLVYLDSSNEFNGKLPALEPGYYYVIEYVIREDIPYNFYGTLYKENNIVVSIENSNLSANDSTSTSVLFEGVRKDLYVYKSAYYQQEGNQIIYNYSVNVNTNYGTNGETINIGDHLDYAYASPNNRVIKNFSIRKYSNGYSTDITNNDYVNIANSLSNKSGSLDDSIFSGTLPALNEGEYYYIYYEIVETYDIGSSFNIGLENSVNVSTNSSKDVLSDSSSEYIYFYRSFSPSISKIFNSSDCDTDSCVIDWNLYLYNYDKLLLDGFVIEDEPENTDNGLSHLFDENGVSVTVNYYSYGSNSFNIESFPVSFKTEKTGGEDKYYLVDGKNNNYELSSLENIRTINFNYNTIATCILDVCSSTDVYNYSYLLFGDNLLHGAHSSTQVDFDSEPPEPPNPPLCNTHECVFKFLLDKEYSGRRVDSAKQYVEFDWKSTVTSINSSDEVPVHYTGIISGLVFEDSIKYTRIGGIGSSSLYIDSFFTKELLSNIQLVNHNNETIDSSNYQVFVSGYDLNSGNVYEEITDVLLADVSDNAYITKFKVEFIASIPYDSANEIVIKYTSYVDKYTLSANEVIEVVNESKFYNKNYLGNVLVDKASLFYKNVDDPTKLLLRKENYISSNIQNKEHFVIYESEEFENVIYYKVTLNEYSSLSGDVDFTDTLPSGTRLVTTNWSFGDLSCSSTSNCNNGILTHYYSYADSTENVWNSAQNLLVNYNSSTNVLNIDVLYEKLPFENDYKLPLILYYAVEYDSLSEDVVFENNATLTDGEYLVNDNTEYSVFINQLEKEYINYDSSTNTLSYKIEVNPDKAVIGNGTTVQIRDNFSYYYYNYDVNSVSIKNLKIFRFDGENEVDVTNSFGYTTNSSYGNYSFDLTLSDQEYYVIYVDYKLDFNDFNVFDYVTNKVSVINNKYNLDMYDDVETYIYEDSVFDKYSKGYDYKNNISSFEIIVNENEEKFNEGNTYSLNDQLYYYNYESAIDSVELYSIEIRDYNTNEIIEMPDNWYSVRDSGSYYYVDMNGFEDEKAYRINISYKFKFNNVGYSYTYLNNYIYVNGKYGAYEYQNFTESSKISKTSLGYNDKDNTLSYKIIFNSNNEILNENNDVVLTDSLDFYLYKDLIKDIKLDSLKVYNLSNGVKGSEVTDLGDDWYTTEIVDGGVYRINMTLPDGKAYYIEYTYKFDYNETDSVNIELYNTLGMDKHSSVVVSTKVVEGAKLFKESGAYDERSNTLDYSVIINPKQETLLNGGKITLIDELDYNNLAGKIIGVKVQDIKLYDYSNGVKGKEITNLEDDWYSESDLNNIHTLNINVYDETAYLLEYTYKFIYDGATLFDASLINNVYIAGVNGAMWNDNVANVITRYGSRAYAITDAYLLSMTKADASDYSKTLPKATYELEKFDGSEWINLGVFTTGDNGSVYIGEKGHRGGIIMLMNHLYRLKEIEAPEGYRLNEEYTYVYNYNGLFDHQYYPEGFDLSKVKLLENNNVYVLNEVIGDNPNTSDVIKFVVPIFIFIVSLSFVFILDKKICK